MVVPETTLEASTFGSGCKIVCTENVFSPPLYIHSVHIQFTGVYTYLYFHYTQQHKEGLSKGQNQENSHGCNPQEGLHDILKHHYIYPHRRLLTEEQNEVDPTQEYTDGSELPLPTWQAVKLEVAHEDDGRHVENSLHVVDDVKEIVSDVVNNL